MLLTIIVKLEDTEMPIYEYACESCGHEFETLQKMSEDPLKECPSCHAPALRRLVSAAGFQLKGTGWYVTDFRGKGKGEKAEKSGSSEKSEKKQDSAPAAGTSTSPPGGS